MCVGLRRPGVYGTGKDRRRSRPYPEADDVMVSTHPSNKAEICWRPDAVPAVPGLTSGSIDNVVVLPFNEAETAARLIEQQADSLRPSL